MNAPAKKWSMNEAWLGARITGPLGTFSAPYPSARKSDERDPDGHDPHELVDPLGRMVAHPRVEAVEHLCRARVLVDLRLDLDVSAPLSAAGLQPFSGSTSVGFSIVWSSRVGITAVAMAMNSITCEPQPCEA